ncbi:MAG: hypothetical protein N0E54_10220 [Candidatus Thiodiazotropha taylori]|nr:hypothetical protein [Candidatus Thiodiazotropha endolucinida]MCW4229101.1 hypothetical protein [Candidatus Thiodiazotropha taylori]
MYKLLNVGVLYLLLIVSGHATAAELEDFSVLILGPMDGKAVLRLPDGKMQVVGNGQSLPGTQATVKQILKDRLVVEDLQAGDPPSVQTVWIYKAASPSEKSRVKRLQKTHPPYVTPILNTVTEVNKEQ